MKLLTAHIARIHTDDVCVSQTLFQILSSSLRGRFGRTKKISRGHGSLTPSHANEAMEFRPEENVDAHSCTCFVETVDQAVLLGCFPALPFDLTFMVFQIDLNME